MTVLVAGERDQSGGIDEALDRVYVRCRLATARRALAPREWLVLSLRFGVHPDGPASMHDVGERLGISAQRVGQIEREALRRARVAVHKDEAGIVRQEPNWNALREYAEALPTKTNNPDVRCAPADLRLKANRLCRQARNLRVRTTPHRQHVLAYCQYGCESTQFFVLWVDYLERLLEGITTGSMLVVNGNVHRARVHPRAA